jgi:hypothetical protein
MNRTGIPGIDDYAEPQSDADADAQKPKSKTLPIVEFADMGAISQKTWLVQHLLVRGEASAFFGEPGAGKSVLIEDIGLHIAAGREWHGRKVAQGAVLFVALERAPVIARRAIAFGREHGLDKAALPFALVRGPLDFRDPQSAGVVAATLEDLARRHHCDPAQIVIDTVSRALNGGDENSPKDMGALIANIGRLQAATGAHVTGIHHQPVDGKERLRGHAAQDPVDRHRIAGAEDRQRIRRDPVQGGRVAAEFVVAHLGEGRGREPVAGDAVLGDRRLEPRGRRRPVDRLGIRACHGGAWWRSSARVSTPRGHFGPRSA